MGTGLKASFTTQLETTSKIDREGVGQIRYEGRNWHKYVKHEDAVAGRVGYVCGYKGVTGYQNGIVSGDTSMAANRVQGAGVYVSTPAANEYCWIIIKGPVKVPAAALAAAVADGQLLAMAGADGQLASGSAAGTRIVAFCVDEGDGEIVAEFPW